MKLPPEDYSREITGTRTEQRVKMNRMRLKIAQRLKDAQNTNAMLTTFNEIDMRYVFDDSEIKSILLLANDCLCDFFLSLVCHLNASSTIMEFRKANLEAFTKKYGIKLGFMSVFSKASAYALQDQPVVNAVIDGNVCCDDEDKKLKRNSIV